MSKKTYYFLFWVSLFSVAMGFLESAVVVYLREIYYPDGFDFPLKLIGGNIAITELGRELATMIMLLGIGFLASDKGSGRFAWFIYSFALWDIFYYVFLKVLLDWPAGLMDWDVLFLIPFTWVGPVIAPILNSLTMILLALVILFYNDKRSETAIGKMNWWLLIVGSIVVIVAYTQDYVSFMMQKFAFFDLLDYSNMDSQLEHALLYIPQSFAWWIFALGFGMHLLAIGLIIFKNQKMLTQKLSIKA